jgi:hypothetical protein
MSASIKEPDYYVERRGSDSVKPSSSISKMELVLFGISSCIFWSIFIVQIPFLANRLGGISALFHVPLTYSLTSNITRLGLIFFASSKQLTIPFQVYSGSVSSAVLMMLLPLCMYLVDSPDAMYWICLNLSALVGVSNSLSNCVGFTLMSSAADRDAPFFMIGQVLTGVMSWPSVMLFRLLTGEDSRLVLTLTLTIASALVLATVPVYRYSTQYRVAIPAGTSAGSLPLQSILRQVAIPLSCSWLARVVTFTVYPSQIGLWIPSNPALYETPIYQSFLIYICPVSDTIGQFVSRFLIHWITLPRLVALTGLRSAIVLPLFILSSLGVSSVVSSDVFRLCLCFFFSFSMAINYTTGNILTSRSVEGNKMTIGSILSFTAVNGVFIGSMISLSLRDL